MSDDEVAPPSGEAEEEGAEVVATPDFEQDEEAADHEEEEAAEVGCGQGRGAAEPHEPAANHGREPKTPDLLRKRTQRGPKPVSFFSPSTSNAPAAPVAATGVRLTRKQRQRAKRAAQRAQEEEQAPELSEVNWLFAD